MADRNLGNRHRLAQQGREIGLTQIMTCIDLQSGGGRPSYQFRTLRQQWPGTSFDKGGSVGAGVDLDALGAQFGCPFDGSHIVIDEQADAAAK